MRIEPFGVEEWMNAHETRCGHNLAETCVNSMSADELIAVSGASRGAVLDEIAARPLTYGAIPGSDELRRAVASLYRGRGRDDVLVAHGTAGANALVWQALIGPGDVVASVVPTYQQHVSIPRALGAEVREVPCDKADWMPRLDALDRAARGAKVIALTNPGNPTGALIPVSTMTEIVGIARRAGAYLLVDEVYRGVGPDGLTPSVADLYGRGISTAGLSKAFALAGLRLGWVVGPPDVLAAVMRHRDYTTISVSPIADRLGRLALEHADAVLARSRAIAAANLARLDDWIAQEPGVEWVRPRAGTVGLLDYGLDIASERLCLDLLAETGVLLTPGSAMGVEGTVRVGFGNRAEDFEAGLPRLSEFLARRRAVAA